MEKREHLYTVHGNLIGRATVEDVMEVPQKIKSRTTMGFAGGASGKETTCPCRKGKR